MNAALGNIDEAYKWLAYEPHHAWLVAVNKMPEFKNMRDVPRFEEFLEELNLPKL